jgi:hypothetical protein
VATRARVIFNSLTRALRVATTTDNAFVPPTSAAELAAHFAAIADVISRTPAPEVTSVADEESTSDKDEPEVERKDAVRMGLLTVVSRLLADGGVTAADAAVCKSEEIVVRYL